MHIHCLGFQLLTPKPKRRPDWHGSRESIWAVVFSIIRLFPSTSQRTQVIDLLRSVQDLTLRVPGCLACWLSEEEYSPNRIRFAQQWESEQSLHHHLRSELYLKVLSAMELSKRQPEVDFYHTSRREGFELIEKMRAGGTPPRSTWQPG